MKMYSQSELEKNFGKAGTNIVSVSVPILGNIWCHKEAVYQITGFLTDIKTQGLSYLISTDEWRRSGGCYVYRQMRGSTRLSHHSWGVALDINADSFPWGSKKKPDSRLLLIGQKWGFVNGSTWSGKKDPMHWEIERLLTFKEVGVVKGYKAMSGSTELLEHINQDIIEREAYGAIIRGGYHRIDVLDTTGKPIYKDGVTLKDVGDWISLNFAIKRDTIPF